METGSGDKYGINKLSAFYKIRGIEEADNSEKRRALKCLVMIPRFPYDQREPCLYELEQQFIKDRMEEKEKV